MSSNQAASVDNICAAKSEFWTTIGQELSCSGALKVLCRYCALKLELRRATGNYSHAVGVRLISRADKAHRSAAYFRFALVTLIHSRNNRSQFGNQALG